MTTADQDAVKTLAFDVLASRVDKLETRMEKTEVRFEETVTQELMSLDRRVQHLEDDGKRMSEKVADLKVDLKENLKWTEEIRHMLNSHVNQENRDRVVLLIGIIATILTVVGTAVFNHISVP